MTPAPQPNNLADIDDSPLPGWSANFRTTALRHPGPRRLLLVPSLPLRLTTFALVAIGVGIPIVLLARAGWDPRGLVWTAAFLQIFTLAGAIFGLTSPRFDFDLDAAAVRVRCLPRRTDIPLPDVLAVQVADGGMQATSKGVPYQTWQLNLVVAGPEGPRLALSSHSDRTWTCSAARRLADFLSIPLLDPTAPADPTA